MVEMCDGELAILIADESSMICKVCHWSGWPRQDVEQGTGRILKVYPHPKAWRQLVLPLYLLPPPA